eukprot:tig00000733_g3768.t1
MRWATWPSAAAGVFVVAFLAVSCAQEVGDAAAPPADATPAVNTTALYYEALDALEAESEAEQARGLKKMVEASALGSLDALAKLLDVYRLFALDEHTLDADLLYDRGMLLATGAGLEEGGDRSTEEAQADLRKGST